MAKLLRGYSSLGILACLCLVMLVAGCSGTTSAGAQATGVITLDGSPLPNAFITFVPKGGGSSAFATSDAQGNFTVKSAESVTGLAPGEYVVVVESGESSGEEAGGESETQGEVSTSGSPIPAKYMSDATSDLTVTISEGEQKAVTLELSSAE